MPQPTHSHAPIRLDTAATLGQVDATAAARDLTGTHTGARRTGARVAAAVVIASACDPCTSLCPWNQ